MNNEFYNFIYIIFKVCFVADKDEGDVSIAERAGVVKPHADVVVGVSVRDVVDKEGSGGAAVVAAGHRAEPVLARSVPDLELDLLPAYLYDLAPELNTDGVRGIILDYKKLKIKMIKNNCKIRIKKSE